MSDAQVCWDCGHLLIDHSGPYKGWDLRGPDPQLTKQPGTGCSMKDCKCRRWFEVRIYSGSP